MYDELISSLREEAEWAEGNEWETPIMLSDHLKQAAEAIEELSKPSWIPFETRPMDEEERQYYSEQYGFGLTDNEAVIYCSDMPDHGQEVLVCNEYGMIWIDTFDDDPDYGVGFETNGDMDGLVAWMPLPQPPKWER